MDQCSICCDKLSQPASGKSDPPAKKPRNNVNESSDVVVTPCGHGFHRSCLQGWFTYKKRGRINGVRPATRGPCPICRMRVSQDELYPFFCSVGSKESATEKPVNGTSSYPHKISSNRIANREERRGNNHNNSDDQDEDENNDEDEDEDDEEHEEYEDVVDEDDEHANGFESDDEDEDGNFNEAFNNW